MAYTQSTVDIPDINKDPIEVPLATGPGITNGSAPIHVDPGIGAIDEPPATVASTNAPLVGIGKAIMLALGFRADTAATAMTVNPSMMSMLRTLLNDRLIVSSPITYRQSTKPFQTNGLPSVTAGINTGTILSDGGNFIATSNIANSACRLRSIQGIAIPGLVQNVDFYGNVLPGSTVVPSSDLYLLIVGSPTNTVGPRLVETMTPPPTYETATYRIMMPAILLPGSRNGFDTTNTATATSPSIGARFVDITFGDYGILFPAGFSLVVSESPSSFVGVDRTGYQVTVGISAA